MKIQLKVFGLVAGVSTLLVSGITSFLLSPQPTLTRLTKRCDSYLQARGKSDDAKDAPSTSRRDLLSKIVSSSIFLAGSNSASAFETEPTRIELNVDTEYLIRVLNYFDGDMRKVLGVLVRSPLTTVQIDPPSGRGDKYVGGSAKDAILRALYSYDSPEDYAEQASWLQVDAPSNKGLVDFLTAKRYEIPIPKPFLEKIDGRDLPGSDLLTTTTSISLSNLEAAVGLGAISYPISFGVYKYEAYQEEQEKLAKKAALAAKKKAAAKKEAEAKKKAAAKKAKEKTAEEAEKAAMDQQMAAQEMQQPAGVSPVENGQNVEQPVETDPSSPYLNIIKPAEHLENKTKKSGGMDAYEAQMAAWRQQNDQ